MIFHLFLQNIAKYLYIDYLYYNYVIIGIHIWNNEDQSGNVNVYSDIIGNRAVYENPKTLVWTHLGLSIENMNEVSFLS